MNVRVAGSDTDEPTATIQVSRYHPKRKFFDIFAIKIFPKKETSIILYNQLSIKEVSYIW